MGNYYFDKETENAIIDFQKEKDFQVRKEIFTARIQPAFSKLIENIIFVYGFKTIENIDVLESDCLSWLFECLCKFDKQKGAAFGYFNVIAKHWFLQEVKLRKKRIQQDIPIDKELLENSEDQKRFIVYAFEEDVISVEFLKKLEQEMYSWRSKVRNNQEKVVLEAVLNLFKNIDDLEILNKKGIYLYLREQSRLNTKQIALNLAKLKKRYFLFKKRFNDGKI